MTCLIPGRVDGADDARGRADRAAQRAPAHRRGAIDVSARSATASRATTAIRARPNCSNGSIGSMTTTKSASAFVSSSSSTADLARRSPTSWSSTSTRTGPAERCAPLRDVIAIARSRAKRRCSHDARRPVRAAEGACLARGRGHRRASRARRDRRSERWFDAMAQMVTPAYLAADTPWEGSGKSGTAARLGVLAQPHRARDRS